MKYTLVVWIFLYSILLIGQNQIIQSEFIYNTAPFPSCHASSLAESPNGLVAVWFGGSHERHQDVGIWLSRMAHGSWTTPIEIANGIQNETLRYPCWNPVLYQIPGKELLLFYKVGPSPSSWWGMLKRSFDHGLHWTAPEKLPDGILGPIKNKPVLLENGQLLCPSSTEDNGWQLHFEISADNGNTWIKTMPVIQRKKYAAIQPSILFHPSGKLQLVCRSKNGYVLSAYSENNGLTWTSLAPTELPNPNSGIDALTLQDGRQLIVYNHVTKKSRKWGGDRSPLNIAISADGIQWKQIATLENEAKMEFSYPAVIQTQDGFIHISYTWKRQRIKHAVLKL